ncbi:uncharacterized protein E0L32_005089 [Thyridium curvatum]|uniref:Uncharacterized protein n=1 Tax=Thyridium curvatum TaxID=1093900 RepID=A0A507B7U9_9PEZI|nr:uncharacterized protein E0L32_005089 [Thyridium curvatum]TPX14694.1 hypothetical protein E0L32_005089 [Thyridium curvatum]
MESIYGLQPVAVPVTVDALFKAWSRDEYLRRLIDQLLSAQDSPEALTSVQGKAILEQRIKSFDSKPEVANEISRVISGVDEVKSPPPRPSLRSLRQTLLEEVFDTQEEDVL